MLRGFGLYYVIQYYDRRHGNDIKGGLHISIYYLVEEEALK
jgi:hypothetical protein